MIWRKIWRRVCRILGKKEFAGRQSKLPPGYYLYDSGEGIIILRDWGIGFEIVAQVKKEEEIGWIVTVHYWDQMRLASRGLVIPAHFILEIPFGSRQ